MPTSRARMEFLLSFHWKYYSELAYQRSRIYDQLKGSLLRPAKSLSFSRWQRTIKYKYSLDPLSTKGSRIDPGGRFNIGEIDTTRFPVFSGLYTASDKGTVIAELLGSEKSVDSLTPLELALTKPESMTVVSVSGNLDSVFDIRNEGDLKEFVDLIKDFRLSAPLKAMVRRGGPISGERLLLIRTVRRLEKELTRSNWRLFPMQFDVPSSSQIFGQIAMDAGIEGIIYNSILTQQPCLAIYPQNFRNSPSYIQLDDPTPSEIVCTRIDRSNFEGFI